MSAPSFRVQAFRVQAFRVQAFRVQAFRVQAFRVRAFRVRARARATALLAFSLCSACVLAPPGTEEERDAVAAAGETYAQSIEERALPALEQPTWRDVLLRACLANGELEAAFFDWQAAFARIEGRSAWPNTDVALGYSYTFSSESLRAFDRMTFTAGFDAMENLAWPNVVTQQGKVALEEARVAGARFRAARLALRREVLSAWAEYQMLARKARIRREQADLARLAQLAATSRIGAGGSQVELVRADVAQREADSARRDAEAELDAQRALLNGMLARAPEEPLPVPAEFEARPLPVDDAGLLAAATQRNPELAGFAHAVAGRADALELARMQWLPEINPIAAFTGSVSWALGAVLVLPTSFREIHSEIEAARAELRGSEAMLRQASFDRTASLVATLIALRNAERQVALFGGEIVPSLERLVVVAETGYAAGGGGAAELLEAQRLLLDAELATVEATAAREQRLAELEALMGVDVETLAESQHVVAAEVRR
jgi:outer membrane protein TolC